jgi:DNA-binding MltR family transcriptional regulator
MDSSTKKPVTPSPLFVWEFELDDIKEFFDESPDRGIAISLPAILDNRLTSILRASMRADEKILNEMFQPSSPLGSFKTKINMAYLLGFIDKEFFLDLVTILKIRNHFAHKLEIKSLEQSPIKGWIKGMSLYAVLIGIKNKIPSPQDPEHAKFATALMNAELLTMRDCFRMCIRFMILRLNEIESYLQAQKVNVKSGHEPQS